MAFSYNMDVAQVNWTVRAIVDRRQHHGRIQYLVDWDPDRLPVQEAAILVNECSIGGKRLRSFVDGVEFSADRQKVKIFWKQSWEPREALSCPELLNNYRKSRRALRVRRDCIDDEHVIDLTQESPEPRTPTKKRVA